LADRFQSSNQSRHVHDGRFAARGLTNQRADGVQSRVDQVERLWTWLQLAALDATEEGLQPMG
jgi:hypothetical protein